MFTKDDAKLHICPECVHRVNCQGFRENPNALSADDITCLDYNYDDSIDPPDTWAIDKGKPRDMGKPFPKGKA